MIVYNFSAEYAALMIIVAILLSFSSGYESKTIENYVLRIMYLAAFVTGLVTVAALVSGVPGTGALHMTVAWVSNTLYFMCLPLVSLCYLIYASLITVMKFDQTQWRNQIFPLVAPYIVYLLVFWVGMTNGWVFSITESAGYVRGVWFQLPYWIVGINLALVLKMVLRHRKTLDMGIKRTMLATTALAAFFLYIQSVAPDTIMTGIIHTACILSIHLYALNVKKNTDQLTRVYNRPCLIQSLKTHVNKDESCSIYVFSLRGMKVINERYGINFGDRVLMRIAQIFISHADDRSVFRYGGDEFALLLDRKCKNHQAVVDAIVADLDTPQVIDDNGFAIDFIYTRVDYDLFGKNPRELISAVDYSIKSLKEGEAGRRYLYDTSVVKALIRRTNMVEQIKDALEHNAFEVHYQPIYCHQTNTFTQAEALVRMRNGEGYLVYPGDFIDLAVKTGLIVQMTYLILEQVCKDLRDILDDTKGALPLESVSVNFPYLQFADTHMPDKVMAILSRYKIPPTMIKIEITEREMVTDTASTRQIMLQMEQMGFGFELDDFGMDYSNMSVVLGLPLETIKLDRSFLLAALENEINMQFFRHLVQGIAGLGATMICEGVEEQAQLDFVMSCGCQYTQGYLFSKPLPREQFQSFLEEKQVCQPCT